MTEFYRAEEILMLKGRCCLINQAEKRAGRYFRRRLEEEPATLAKSSLKAKRELLMFHVTVESKGKDRPERPELKVDAKLIADLPRTDLVTESHVADKQTGARRAFLHCRTSLVKTRTEIRGPNPQSIRQVRPYGNILHRIE